MGSDGTYGRTVASVVESVIFLPASLLIQLSCWFPPLEVMTPGTTRGMLFSCERGVDRIDRVYKYNVARSLIRQLISA
jgi:hypothetical protein